MKTSIDKTTQQIIGLGLIAGSRATFAPALAAHYFSRHKNDSLAHSKLGFIQTPLAAIVTKLLTSGEIAGDKLPTAPDRIELPGLVGRMASGALSGAIVSTANKADVTKGVLIGAAVALAATFASFYLRKFASNASPYNDKVTGTVEDALAIAGGMLLMK